MLTSTFPLRLRRIFVLFFAFPFFPIGFAINDDDDGAAAAFVQVFMQFSHTCSTLVHTHTHTLACLYFTRKKNRRYEFLEERKKERKDEVAEENLFRLSVVG